MKTIFIHCGMPKTGSSALQVQLSTSRRTFLEHGYDYLPMGDFQQAANGRITSGNAASLARAYLNPEHPAQMIELRKELTEKFRARISQSNNHIILSSEFFSALPAPNLAEIVAAFSDLGKIELVFFVRDQLNALASNYIQQVKRHGLTRFPDEYFANWDRSKAPMMNFHGYFTRLKSLMPDTTIHAKPYEFSKNHPTGLMGLFLEMIHANIPSEALPVDSRINLSPSPHETRLMIEINKHHPRMKFSDMVVESSFAAGRSNIHAQHAIMPPAIVQLIRDAFQEGNDIFFKETIGAENSYCSDWDEETFVDLRKVKFDANQVIDILSGLLVNLDRRLAKLEGEANG